MRFQVLSFNEILPFSLSDTMAPLCKVITLFHGVHDFLAWVAIRTVVPLWLIILMIFHDLTCSCRIQVTGRLICNQDRRIVNQSPGQEVLCCSPPDSWPGKELALGARPTMLRTAGT